MKTIHVLLISSVLFLWLGVAHSTPMEAEFDPGLTFTWDWPDTFTSFIAPTHVSTWHFRWEYDPELPYERQVGRIVAMERFLYEVERRQPVATPEPGTWLLLASGLGILVWRKRR